MNHNSGVDRAERLGDCAFGQTLEDVGLELNESKTEQIHVVAAESW
jgi:hypothetical protein